MRSDAAPALKNPLTLVNGHIIRPANDSVTAIQIAQANSTAFVNFDTNRLP